MNRKLYLLLICLYPLSLFCFENNDSQFWSSFTLYKNFSEQTNARVGAEFKFGEDMSTHYTTRFDMGVTHHPLHWASVGFSFKRVNIMGDESWIHWDVPYGDLVLETENKVVKIDLRNRLEYWVRPEVENFWRVRQRLRLSSVPELTVARLQPYTAGEYFYNFTSLGLKMTRIYLGSKLLLSETIEFDFFYCYQTITIDNNWLTFHVLGTTVGISF